MGSFIAKHSSRHIIVSSKPIAMTNAKMKAKVILANPIVVNKTRMDAIKGGHISTDMDDRWHFVSTEASDGNVITTSILRSWTRSEIFRAKFERVAETSSSNDAQNGEKWILRTFAWNDDTSVYRPHSTAGDYLTGQFQQVLNDYFPEQ